MWVVVLASSLVLSLLFIEPFSFDNAVYPSIAADLLRQRRIPYLRSFDQNFPGIMLMHVLAITLFGAGDDARIRQPSRYTLRPRHHYRRIRSLSVEALRIVRNDEIGINEQ